MHFTTLSTCIALFSATGWAAYVLEDDYFSGNFFDEFTFWDQDDPTHGFVDYQGQKAASDAGLINITSSGVYMGVDHTNECPNGRPSVRISSNRVYNTGLVVIDLAHMPGSICGAWPAFWMLGPNWPNGGEVDIIEGVNDQVGNKATLHTGPGCSIDKAGDFSGSVKYTTCASGGDSNNGCQIAEDGDVSYGTNFNENGGGTYATEWTADYISVWFWPRGSCPDDVLGKSPDPSGWGVPFAKFQGDCNFGTSFKDQQLVFDTTFCGDWAGNAWANSTCASKTKVHTCDAYVQSNPEAFTEAYWSINALKVYNANGESSPSISTYIETATSISYVTQPESSYVAQTTMPTAYPTTLALSTKPAGYGPLPESTSTIDSNSPSETGSSYAPIVAEDGTIGEGSGTGATPPTYTGVGGGRFSNADGALGYSYHHGPDSRDLDEETRDRHARHLRAHKRHGKGRL